MSRASIRAEVASYLTGAGITGLTTVYQHPPKQTGEGEFIAPGNDAGAVIFVHLSQQSERRIADGGPTSGMKMRAYQVALICVYRSKEPDTETVGAGNDAFLDSLVTAIEENRAPGPIWQWGEGDTLSAPDIHIEAGMPRPIRQQASQVWSIATVDVLELLTT